MLAMLIGCGLRRAEFACPARWFHSDARRTL